MTRVLIQRAKTTAIHKTCRNESLGGLILFSIKARLFCKNISNQRCKFVHIMFSICEIYKKCWTWQFNFTFCCWQDSKTLQQCLLLDDLFSTNAVTLTYLGTYRYYKLRSDYSWGLNCSSGKYLIAHCPLKEENKWQIRYPSKPSWCWNYAPSKDADTFSD